MTTATTDADVAAKHASRWLAAGGLALVGATWPLWTGTSSFPQVPFLSGLRAVPPGVDGILLGGLLLAWLTVLAKPAPHRAGRIALLVAAGLLSGLLLLNQHRLQPWAWEFLLVGLLLGCAVPAAALSGWRWLVVSIYAWSALSKLDVTFFHSHGPFLLEGLFRALGWPDALALWGDAARTRLAVGIPLTELAIALTLAIPSARLVGLVGALAMHLVLLLALGPMGHGHQPGVLLWNVFFIGQNLLLFVRPPAPCRPWRDQPRPTQLAWAITAVAIGMPALEPLGGWDHWPGWAVYASRPERVFVTIAEADAQRLPHDLQAWLEPAQPFQPWRQLRIDRWSLAAVGAPIYPQDRFAIGVALAVAGGPGSPDVRIERHSPAHHFTGQRTIETATGTKSVTQFARRFRLNALPRSSRAGSEHIRAPAAPSPLPAR